MTATAHIHRAAPGRGRWLVPVLVAGAAGWATFALLLGAMLARTPPGAAFDLELLLTGGRRVADGISPYEPSMLAGQSVGITTLFFSYPPLVAQALAPLASVPTILVLLVLIAAGALGAAGVSSRLATQANLTIPGRRVFVISLALLPFWFPFAVAMLFGNLDTLFLRCMGWCCSRPSIARHRAARLCGRGSPWRLRP